MTIFPEDYEEDDFYGPFVEDELFDDEDYPFVDDEPYIPEPDYDFYAPFEYEGD